MIAEDVSVVGIYITDLADDIAAADVVLGHDQIAPLEKVSFVVRSLGDNQAPFGGNRTHITDPVVAIFDDKRTLRFSSGYGESIPQPLHAPIA